MNELLLYFAAIGSKHTLVQPYCVPSSAHPPVASSGCIPLTLPIQQSMQSIIDTNGARHMTHSAEQELPLQSCLDCVLKCKEPGHGRAERGHNICNQSPVRLVTWAHGGLSLHRVCSSIPSRGPCPLLSPWSKLMGAYAPALLTSTSTVPSFCAAVAKASTPFGPLKSAVTTSAPAAPFSLQLAAAWVLHTSCFSH